MYSADPDPVLSAIARMTAPGGLVSLLVRNGDALAMRPGLLGDWAACAEAFDSDRYPNRLGVTARADRLADLTGRLAGHGLQVTAWYGVRVFTDAEPDDAEPPPDLHDPAGLRGTGWAHRPVPAGGGAAAPDRAVPLLTGRPQGRLGE